MEDGSLLGGHIHCFLEKVAARTQLIGAGVGQDVDIKGTLTYSVYSKPEPPGISCSLNMGLLPREAKRSPKTLD